MKTNFCSGCGVEKTRENTGQYLTGPRKGVSQGYCKICSRKRNKKRRDENPEEVASDARRRKDEFRAKINSIKSERPCYDCGGVHTPEAMDFDHVSGTKKFDVTRGWIYTWDSVREEIDKCQLVCAICHRIRTQRRRSLNVRV